jgi:rhodanese-related sulfurtransferase
VSATRVLALVALASGALAVVAGRPARGGGSLDVARLAQIVEHEEDHVTAIELARWIRDRHPRLRVVDIRDSADFESYHVPGAERLDLEHLVTAQFTPDQTIVLYSGGGAHAAQGWVFLRARGLTKVYFLRGGLDEWMSEVINPQFPRNATPRERVEIDSVRALSKYFDGSPRIVDSTAIVPLNGGVTWKQSVAKMRGRGC